MKTILLLKVKREKHNSVCMVHKLKITYKPD